MEKDQLIRRLMATFLEELDEHVRALNRDLLELEKETSGAGRSARLTALFRTAHSLKGAARSVNVGLLESACHALEEILAAARDGRVKLDAGRVSLLFAAIDGIEEAGMRLREEQDLGGAPLAQLLPQLEAAADGTAVGRGSPAPAAPATAPPEAVAPAPPAPPPATAVPPPAPVEPPPDTTSGAGTVRVPAEKLDALLAQNGEMLLARRRLQERAEDLLALRERVGRWRAEWQTVEKALRPVLTGDQGRTGPLPRRAMEALGQTGERLRRLEKDLERLTASLAADSRFLNQTAGALDEEVRRVRMLPFAEACQGLGRMARDLAQAAGKELELVIEGGDVELDRSILEGLKDPLRHLVRNAVDHGAEPPAERLAAGKNPRAQITVAAALRGAQVEVVVGDDGRGLDLEALRQQARQRHLAEPADPRELARLIFLPEFTTSRKVTDVSGRGVGLDVVKSRVEALHGVVDLETVPGQGARFTLAVPLTLTTLRAVLVQAGGQAFAFAGTSVQKLVRIDLASLRTVEGRPMLALHGVPLPAVALAETLGLRVPAPTARGKVPALIMAAGEKRVAFLVDEFVSEQEVLIKDLGARLRRLPHVSGATILPSGQIALVLNAANLIRTALGRAPVLAAVEAPAAARKRVLVVDDSVTTRTLEKSVLEAAGYEVAVAADGQAAWQLLQERGADLVVSDVEMPRMDGFTLTETIRAAPRFRELPVVLVTARETEQDRTRGIAVGADAYLGKSAFDQKELVETIRQLL